MRSLAALALAGLPAFAQAHAVPGAAHWWTLDPLVLIPIMTASWLYLRGMRRRKRQGRPGFAAALAAIYFYCGMVAVCLALVWPLDALGEISFAAHMAQHMVLIAVAAPLFAISRPGPALLLGLPLLLRRFIMKLRAALLALAFLARPRIAFVIHGVMIWAWHAPLLFEWALRSREAHIAEHVSFLGGALLFWSALQRSPAAYGEAVLLVLATMMHTGILGALLTFAPRPIYPFYASHAPALLPSMEDQQLAGLLMWVPGGLCYLLAGLVYAALWMRAFPDGNEGRKV